MAVFSYSMSFVTLWLRVQIVQIFHDGASLGYIIKLFNTFPIIELLISVMLLVILIVLIRKIDRWYRMRVVSTFLLMFAVFSLIGLGVSYFQLDNIFQIKHTSAIVALVIQPFSPERIQPPSTFFALVDRAAKSLPASGSLMAVQPINSPLSIF